MGIRDMWEKTILLVFTRALKNSISPILVKQDQSTDYFVLLDFIMSNKIEHVSRTIRFAACSLFHYDYVL